MPFEKDLRNIAVLFGYNDDFFAQLIVMSQYPISNVPLKITVSEPEQWVVAMGAAPSATTATRSTATSAAASASAAASGRGWAPG